MSYPFAGWPDSYFRPPSATSANRVARAFIFAIGGSILFDLYLLRWFAPSFDLYCALFLGAAVPCLTGLPLWGRRSRRTAPLVAGAIGLLVGGRAVLGIFFPFSVEGIDSDRATYGPPVLAIFAVVTVAFAVTTVILALQPIMRPAQVWNGFQWVAVPGSSLQAH